MDEEVGIKNERVDATRTETGRSQNKRIMR